MNLTDEEIRIKVAEACGWRQVEQSDGDYINGPSPVYPWTNGKDWCDETGEDLPNYPQDLNACAEFEATLSSAERFTYLVELNKLCGDEPSCVWATARQRCLAYLKVKGILP